MIRIKTLNSIFSENDLRQINLRRMDEAKLLQQLDLIRKGTQFVAVEKSCAFNDGIFPLNEVSIQRYEHLFAHAQQAGHITKFIPASGASTRMFQSLLLLRGKSQISPQSLELEAQKGSKEAADAQLFFQNLSAFAFTPALEKVLLRDGLSLNSLLEKGGYSALLDYLFGERGLALSFLPKALIPFHKYAQEIRTSFAEHLVDAEADAADATGLCRIHFTVSPEHRKALETLAQESSKAFTKQNIRYEISFSEQLPHTDTIAADEHFQPFRDGKGQILFRPAGHGVLLENLQNTQSDIIFLKNIDNVQPDRLKPEALKYRRAMGGLLIYLQQQIFSLLNRLEALPIFTDTLDETSESRTLYGTLFAEIVNFAEQNLGLRLPEEKRIPASMQTGEVLKNFFLHLLNRPIRVCAMIKNQGEPGGGPFWVRDGEGILRVQILEIHQIDITNPLQASIVKGSTHFNPVDIVCGLRDKNGSPFNLLDFVDNSTYCIIHKSYLGRDLLALEWPGLWNGAMGFWNTVFVELPATTFSPVKKATDLLRPEHKA